MIGVRLGGRNVPSNSHSDVIFPADASCALPLQGYRWRPYEISRLMDPSHPQCIFIQTGFAKQWFGRAGRRRRRSSIKRVESPFFLNKKVIFVDKAKGRPFQSWASPEGMRHSYWKPDPCYFRRQAVLNEPPLACIKLGSS